MSDGSNARTFASPIDSPADGDGKVTWRGLQPGSYHVVLSIPRRTGPRMEIPLAKKVEIAKGAKAIDIDIGASGRQVLPRLRLSWQRQS